MQIMKATESAIENETKKLSQEVYSAVELAQNASRSLYTILNPSGHLSVNVKLDLAPELQSLATKFLLIIPFCLLLIILIFGIFYFVYKLKQRCSNEIYEEKIDDESFY